MATLIPEITISEFKKLSACVIKRMKSCEITSDGEYLGTFLRCPTTYLRDKAESDAQMANSVSGETLEEIKQDGSVEVNNG